MYIRLVRLVVIFIILFISFRSYGQQDVDFHLNAHLLLGKTILKIKRDFNDEYLWVLAKNNEVYRVNSLTQAVDDYTAQFSAYNNLPFIDIAGRSKDTVYLATRSANLIQYKQGVVKLVRGSAGVGDTVTSIGVDYSGRKFPYGVTQIGHILMVGTVNGMYRFDMDAETSTLGSDKYFSKVFEATYRRDLFSGFDNTNYPDTISYNQVDYNTTQTIYREFVWLGGKQFGKNLNTVFYAPGAFNDSDQGSNYVACFWGNEKGMSENNRDNSYSSMWPSAHFLDNINVNKITDIFGLTKFGDLIFYGTPGLTQQTLLIGTDNGLYFSSSIYQRFDSGKNGFYNGLRKFTLFHYDELGNIPINDVSVNTFENQYPNICEDGVWVATNQGLYYLKPDYAKYLNSQQYHAIHFKDQADNVADMKVCQGEPVTAVVGIDKYKGISIQWYKNGTELPGENKSTLSIKSSGDYYAVLYGSCEAIHIETNHLKADIAAGPVFTFAYPDKLQYCDSTSITLKTDYSSFYHYRWYSNGVLNGDTTNKFAATQSGKYKVEVSGCTNSWVPSKEVKVALIRLPVPNITMDKAIYCSADMATLSAGVPLASDYTVNWYRDGVLLNTLNDKTSIKTATAGSYSVMLTSTISNCTRSSLPRQLVFTSAPVFTFNYPNVLKYCDGTPVTLKAEGYAGYHYRWYKDGGPTGDTSMALNITQAGSYNVEASVCVGSWVPSKTVKVDFIKLPVPVITTDKPGYCIGDIATLLLNVPLNANYTINWFRDHTPLPAYKNLTSVNTAIAGNYNVSLDSDQPVCVQVSAEQLLMFNQQPTISIQKIGNITLCDGRTVDLKVDYAGGTVKWSTGEQTQQITVRTSGFYQATVKSPAGCVSDANINIQFLPAPALHMKDTSICVFSRETITLTAPDGFSGYSWNNGTSTGKTFNVSTPQTVSLTVTDGNGCQAVQQVVIASHCPDVRMANTFTPNGDGINDTWTISGIENDPTLLIRVYNRYGSLVYESKGYYTPWNGQYHGKKLPPGTYYYVISAKGGKQTFSGPVTILL
ncbi:hypothetical protein BH09BAC6_BH09BAC6_10790 [soil metagenome]